MRRWSAAGLFQLSSHSRFREPGSCLGWRARTKGVRRGDQRPRNRSKAALEHARTLGRDRPLSRCRPEAVGLVGRGQGDARPVRAVGEGGGLHGRDRSAGQHLRPPWRQRSVAAAGRDRQPSRHPDLRWPLRRHPGRAVRARGGAHAERSRPADQARHRGDLLDQRGGRPLRSADDGLWPSPACCP